MPMFKCRIVNCDRSFTTKQGLKVHKGLVHNRTRSGKTVDAPASEPQEQAAFLPPVKHITAPLEEMEVPARDNTLRCGIDLLKLKRDHLNETINMLEEMAERGGV